MPSSFLVFLSLLGFFNEGGDHIYSIESLEIKTAIQALIMASSFCQRIKKERVESHSLLKGDRSPVTIADYGSQAIINKLIKERFPNDPIVAEEDAEELKKAENLEILNQVTHYVNEFIPRVSSREICSWIDWSTSSVKERFWTLDPIDGTKGFQRGDQYAIALALIEEGEVQIGLLACPNLYVDKDQPGGKKGCLFFAMVGNGAFQMDMESGEKRSLSVSRTESPEGAIFTESVEPDHADHLTHKKVAKRLNVLSPPILMDSQAKYGIVARGEATVYIRVPSPSDPHYREKIWDHAAGALIAKEAGGKVTDILGRPLDFSCGLRLEKNRGILVTNGILHETILKALENLVIL